MVDITEFPVPGYAADKVDQSRVIVLDIAEECLVDQAEFVLTKSVRQQADWSGPFPCG